MSTYKQIAQMAGVSVSTVSKALSGSCEISENTRKTVFLIAEQTGYFEKRSKRKMAYSKDNVVKIAIIYPENSAEGLNKEVHALSSEIKRNGSQPFVYYDNSDNFIKLINQFTAEGMADGFIVKGLNVRENFPLPVVSVSAGTKRLPYSTVEIADNSMLFSDAVKYFSQKSHNNVGCVGNDANLNKIVNSVVKKNNKSLNKSFLYITECGNEQCGVLAAETIARQKIRPDTLFVPACETAAALVNRLEFYGISVPDDLLVMTVGGGTAYGCKNSRLKYFTLDYESMAEIAVKQICREIKGEKEKKIHTVCKHYIEE